MNKISNLCMIVASKQDTFSSDRKVTDFQVFAPSDDEIDEISQDFVKSSTGSLSKFNIHSEKEMFLFLKLAYRFGKAEDFEKAFNLVVSHTDSEIVEKIVKARENGVFTENGTKQYDPLDKQVEGYGLPFDDELETLSYLLDKINDPELKELVLTKFKASMEG